MCKAGRCPAPCRINWQERHAQAEGSNAQGVEQPQKVIAPFNPRHVHILGAVGSSTGHDVTPPNAHLDATWVTRENAAVRHNCSGCVLWCVTAARPTLVGAKALLLHFCTSTSFRSRSPTHGPDSIHFLALRRRRAAAQEGFRGVDGTGLASPPPLSACALASIAPSKSSSSSFTNCKSFSVKYSCADIFGEVSDAICMHHGTPKWCTCRLSCKVTSSGTSGTAHAMTYLIAKIAC